MQTLKLALVAIKAGPSSSPPLGVSDVRSPQFMGRAPIVSPAMVRSFAAAAAFTYLAFVVLAPHTADGVRQVARAHWWVASQLHAAPPPLLTGSSATPAGASPVEAVEAVRVKPPRPAYPPCRCSLGPVPPSVDEALGVSIPKSARWAVLGGHGRHGAG